MRETLEEAGIAVAISGDAVAVRAALHGGAPLRAIDRDALEALVPFARWRPDLGVARRFDTWFFADRAPAGAEAVVDGTENVRACWTRPAAVLAGAAAGDVRLLYPTRRVLERLALHGDVAAVLADAAAWPTPVIAPRVEWRNGAEQLCIPDGLGYPVTAEPLDGVLRG